MKRLVLKNKIIDLEQQPVIMGILNVTPDSFSDGNLFFNLDNALSQADKLIKNGADIIDIGGESSRPGALSVGLQEELDRILPVVEAVKKEFEIPISVDTYKYGVAESVAKSGVEMINDITALEHSPMIAQLAAQNQLAICLMHMRGTPQTMQAETNYDDLIAEVSNKLIKAAELCMSAGIKKESIVLDPGIGFGKSTDGNILLLKRLMEFSLLGFPILIGTSRKSFIGKLLGLEVDERLSGTIASNVVGLYNGARIFRVHDVKEHRQALNLAWEIIREKAIK